MKTKQCLEIKFEAFGKHHTLYGENRTATEIIQEVALICPTAHVESISNTKIELSKFHENNLSSLVEWNRKIKLFEHEL
jgi:hypothetical protein